jgi:hypothetical protein
MADAAEWGAYSERDDQEDSWDGAARTAEMGPAWADADLDRPPDHVPHLHRAMTEAAADLEAVDDRLSTLFDRTEEPRTDAGSRPAPDGQRTVHPEFVADPGTAGTTGAGVGAVAGDDDMLDLFEDGEVSDADDDVEIAEPVVTDRMAIIGEYEDDIGGDFAALDAELAAEAPDGAAEPKRRMFRRRAKGTTAARR